MALETLKPYSELMDVGLGRWLSAGLIKEDGGRNLYGFVGNDGVINAYDILGREPAGTDYEGWGGDNPADHGFTEKTARLAVGREIAKWQNSGYYFAADLFTHFLNQRGPVYTPSKFNIAETKVEGKKNMCRLIKKEVQNNPTLAPLNVNIKPKHANDSNIRWYPYIGDSWNMVYAYGGARFTASACADSNGKGVFSITLKGVYEYNKNDGLGDQAKQVVSSFLRRAYAAAVYLESIHRYQTFKHTSKFELECSGKE